MSSNSTPERTATLKPTKQTMSDTTGNMRTTRSKAKAKEQDQHQPLSEVTVEALDSETSGIFNGNSEQPASGNLEKLANVSINLRPAAKHDLENSHNWRGEESKQQSPKSQFTL